MSKKYKSGFISVIGNPNVGKSTLINNLVGKKVSITSPKVQTTRNVIRAIRTDENCQMIFLDTPGIHNAENKLSEFMNKQIEMAMSDFDLLIYLIDGPFGIGNNDEKNFSVIKKLNKKNVICIINKIDISPSSKNLVEIVRAKNIFSEVIGVSAKTSENIEKLTEVIEKILPEGPMYYPENMYSDFPEQFIYAEIIREKVIYNTDQEVPHSIAVRVKSIRDNTKKITIEADIYVERESQKGIIIGKRGQMIRLIGTKARHELEKIAGQKIFLELHVKVKNKWRNNDRDLIDLGYEE